MRKRRIVLGSLLSIVIFVVIDLVLPSGHAGHEFWWSAIPAFFLFFGFIGCILLIVIPKFLEHKWLERKEDYYD